MVEARTNRRLAAILAADVVGYSRMMASDETGTLAALKRHRKIVFDPTVAQYDGRIVKLIGDGTLVEFGSVVAAVDCALSIQRTAAMPTVASETKIVLRIGINLGDVIIEGDDIYGEGVNIAARLESLAEPGGICVASIVHESVRARIDVVFKDGGAVQVKNAERPIRIWKWHPTAGSENLAVAPQTIHIDLPSLAVLPFHNLGGDPEQEYFADGVVEELITGLSRFKSFAVIARNSSFVYKGRSVDVRQVARELGVRYVLEGSVRRSGSRLRISAQLIDGNSGGHLWAQNFDGAVVDIFEFQDRIAESVVGLIEPEIRKAEIERARRKRPDSLDAYDLYLRAVPLVYGMDPDGFPVAIELLDKAAALDPSFALAPTYAAWTYEKRGALSLPPLGPNDREICLGLARRALALGGDDPLVRAICGWVLFAVGGDVSARNALYQAKAANPNSVVILVLVGFAKVFDGDFDTAYELFSRAYRLSPGAADSYQSLHGLGVIEVLRGNYEDGVEWCLKSLATFNDWPQTYRVLAAGYAHLGRMDEAAAAIRRLREIAPHSTIEQLISGSGLKHDTITPALVPALRNAGLPER